MFYVNCAKVDQSIQVDWLDGYLTCASNVLNSSMTSLALTWIVVEYKIQLLPLAKKYDFEPSICKSKKMKKKLGEMLRNCIIFLLLMFPTCKGLKQNEVKTASA